MSSSIAEFHPAFQWAVNQTLAQCSASVGSGFRTIEEQRALLYKRAQGILVADPGTSRHEGNHFGAVDMEGDLDCFARVGAQYGLTNQDVPGEPWHFQFTAEAEQAVIDGAYDDIYGMAEEFGAEEQAEPEVDDWGAGVRAAVFGQGGPENPVDVPERVAQAFAPEEREAVGVETQPEMEGFVPQASAGYSGGGEPMSAVDVAKVYAQAGFTGDALVTMVAIAHGESGLDPDINGDTSITSGTWGPSIGLSQIRSLNAEHGTGGWRDATRLTDPVFNAKAAFAISNGGSNFGPWTVYSKGIYQEYVDEAKAAVVALGTGAYQPKSKDPVASVDPEADDLGLDDITSLDPVSYSQEIAEMVLAEQGGFGFGAGTESPVDRLKVKKEKSDA